MKKTCSNRKSDFCNKLLLMSPLKHIPPTDIKVCVVDAMRVLRLIPITTIQSPNVYEMGRDSKIVFRKPTRKHITCCI